MGQKVILKYKGGLIAPIELERIEEDFIKRLNKNGLIVVDDRFDAIVIDKEKENE